MPPAVRVAIVFGLSLSACHPAPTSHSHPDFGVFNDEIANYSVLKTIDAHGGALDACVAFVDQNKSVEEVTRTERILRNAVNEWNALLVGYDDPAWTHETITVKVTNVVEGKRCPVDPNVVGLNLYGTDAGWKKDFPDPESRSHAIPWETAFDIEPSILNGLEENYAFGIRHEYGHLLGLADTYDVPGESVPIHQPKAAMKEFGKPLMEDDRAGVRAVWKYIKIGRKECGPGYKLGATKVNKDEFLFCVPSATPDPTEDELKDTPASDQAAGADPSDPTQCVGIAGDYKQVIDPSQVEEFHRLAIEAGYTESDISFTERCGIPAS